MATMQPQLQQQPNIWAQMAYTAPRGPCSLKTSIVSTCTCYRFMIHPLKAGTSFDCDGCGHHASFHRMESREEEEVVRRWKGEREREVELEMEEKETGRRGMGRGMIEGVGMDEGMVVVAPGKKRRLIGGVERDVVENMGEDEDEEAMSIRSDRKTAAAGKKRKGRV